ncbi:PDZ domain-containing protein [Mucilaginibacter conchicola]|uniref:PDZ domain-containing protein n=1 Tax=Mucilaginibacter conchicola TaxID=2303333 RepID=A0A372NWY5_9SPHI|nr:S41 family peptidase [Mucilaginibacter conchicola]RFZ94628.1 PDZ domain-containing protein [Mucilaginibacter conchicola]
MRWHKGIYVMAALLVLFSCKKDNTPKVLTADERQVLTLDSIYLYAQQIYLWNDALPDIKAFNTQQYKNASAPLAGYAKEVLAISQLKINPATGMPYEKGGLNNVAKYSYITNAIENGAQQAAVSLNDTGDDYGLLLAEYGTNDVRVAMVSPGSPAAAAGMQRGDRILTVNGTSVTTGTNTLNQALNANAIQLGLQATNGNHLVNLSKATYASSPVLKDAIFTEGNAKVGYLALARFSVLSQMQSAVTASFQNFEKESVSSLIVDLRYNGGGYVESAEYLADLIAPASLQGKVSYAEHFNTQMQQGQATILKNQPYRDSNGKPVYSNGKMVTYADVDFSVKANTHTFNKKGSLQSVKQLYFIVSPNTASAAELLINIFKPYFDVKLIGTTTYGKPVGFFPLSIDSYSLYLSNFQIKNASGEGDYYSGMPATNEVYDDVTHNFGDTQEACLATALALISGQSASITALRTRAVTGTQPLKLISSKALTGEMTENRFNLK